MNDTEALQTEKIHWWNFIKKYKRRKAEKRESKKESTLLSHTKVDKIEKEEIKENQNNSQLIEGSKIIDALTGKNLKSIPENEDIVKEEKLEVPVDKKEDTFELKEMGNDEASIKNLDKSFYTNSMSFSKEDFEGFDELEKTVKKNNKMVKLGIVALVLLALATIFIVLKYVLNLF